MSCALKAVAAEKNKTIHAHRDLGVFAKTLSKQERNQEIFRSFSHASTLHRNFYESNLDPGVVESLCFYVAKTVGRLMVVMGYGAP